MPHHFSLTSSFLAKKLYQRNWLLRLFQLKKKQKKSKTNCGSAIYLPVMEEGLVLGW